MTDARAGAAPPNGRKLFVEAFGCQMNVLDGELAASQLAAHGWGRTHDADEADLVLFNTCSVRDQSENKVWSRLGALRERKQRDGGLLIGVMGCMAQREAETVLRRMPHVDVVVGTRRFPEIADLVARAEREGPVLAVATDGYVDVVRDVRIRPERHRAFVSVMRGCDHKCSYCIVPRTRGPQVDREPADVLDEVARLAADGVREVTLLGQNINTYGRTLAGQPTLGGLIRRVHEVPGVDRIRFLTSNPMDLRDDLLRSMAEVPAACGYLHFPAQSGSDAVLRRMYRGYTRAKYLELCARARELCPGIELATDLIVGFPGETDAEFEDTLRLVGDVGFKQVYVFKYSVRPGTAAAAACDDDVPWGVKRDRKNALLGAQDRISAARNATRVGGEEHVLVDGPSARNAARLSGRGDGNHVVIFDGPKELAGRFTRVRVTRSTHATLYGERIPDSDP